LRLNGLGDAHIQEAGAVAQSIVGFAAYLPSIDYSVEKFREELDASVDYIQRPSQ
jgi:hypothetical protein